jgi:hypothetical protein
MVLFDHGVGGVVGSLQTESSERYIERSPSW